MTSGHLRLRATALALAGLLASGCGSGAGDAEVAELDGQSLDGQGSAPDGSQSDSSSPDGKLQVDAKPDAKTDAKTDVQPQELLPASDRPALLHLQAWAALPTEHTAAMWTGVKVLQAPTALVVFDEDDIARRAYLLGFSKPPAGALAVTDPALTKPVWRWDAAATDAFDQDTAFGDVLIGETSTLLVPVSAQWLLGQGPKGPWAHLVGGAAMDRWRMVEGNWPLTAPCGQPAYPRDQQAIALFLLECTVLSEAVTATDQTLAQQRLMEWYAIRADYTANSAALMTRIRHYDRVFAPAWYGGRRLAVLAGLRTQAEVEAEYVAMLAKPLTVAAEQFDSTVGAIGWPGAAALEVARRLGWAVNAEYLAGGSVWTALPQWGAKPSTPLIEQAKGRHNWALMVQQAAAVMALADGLAP